MTSLQCRPHLPPGCSVVRTLPNTPEPRKSESQRVDDFCASEINDLIALADDRRVSDAEMGRRFRKAWQDYRI